MMQKYYSLLILISLFASAANAQDSSRTHRITLSGNYVYQVPFHDWYISGLQVGYGWQNKKMNWHDFDLTGAYAGFKSNSHLVSIGLRYQHTVMPFRRFDNSRFKPFIGFGAEYSISHSKGEYDNVINRYETRHFTNSLQPYISPGFEFNFSKKFYTSLQFPIPLMRLNTVSSRHFDPGIPAGDQSHTHTSLQLLPLQNIQARLTLGYKF
ncbi:MAG: hypothetical protein EOP53_07845 [Sphingobacteriales bacterium]|nr:MAG: hypothetical protein EOP53_07845 [Sphingobacteriales bacterium]